MSGFPLEIEVDKRKGRKVQQVIWVKPLTFSKILLLADKYGVAPNTVISEILDKVMVDQSIIFKDKVVEKVVKKVVCPLCLSEFVDVESFKDHFAREHPDIHSLIHGGF